MLLASSSPAAEEKEGHATLVAPQHIPAGTSTTDMDSYVETVVLPSHARALGSVASLGELPDGVVATELVPNQQILTTSIVADVVDALGDDLVAISVRLEAQRWSGPLRLTGNIVTVYTLDADTPEILASGVRVLDAPSAEAISPRSEQLITLAIRADIAGQLIAAATNDQLWLVGS